MAESSQLNILIETGADFVLPYTIYDNNGDPIDLTGSTITSHLRRYAEAAEFYEFVCSHNGSGGRVVVTMPKEVTAKIPYPAGVYDIKVTLADGVTSYPLKGNVTIREGVTRTLTGSLMYSISVATLADLPGQGISNRFYYVSDEKAFYIWNGTGYIEAIYLVEPVGEWDAETPYFDLNIVTKDGFAFIAKQNVPAGTPLSDTDYWMQITYGLTIGTVVTVDSNTQAGATITGIPLDPKLNLWIPKGEKGDKGEGLEDVGALAQLDVLDYESDYLINKPEPYQDYLLDILARIKKFYPDLPWEIFLAIYLQEETLYIPDIYAEYVDTEEDPELVILHNGTTVSFLYDSESEALIIKLNPQKHVEEAPMDDRYYVRQNGHWVPVELNNIGGGE